MPQQAACHHQKFERGDSRTATRRMRRRRRRKHPRRECPADRLAFTNSGCNADTISHPSTDTNGC
jgi:hypothetical protein